MSIESVSKNQVVEVKPVKPKTRPTIGIVAWKIGENSVGVTLPYLIHFQHYGNVKVILPTHRKIENIDLLVIPGGPDVDPNRYGDFVSYYTQKPDPLREWFDIHMLPQYINAGIGVFGICRGHQTLAVHFGAKLKQHMWHETNPVDDRSKLVHNVCWINLNGQKSIEQVNSIHHQVVANVPEHAKVVAWHTKEKTFTKNTQFIEGEHHIEALIYPNHKCASVQFHPEEINHIESISDSLIKWLLE